MAFESLARTLRKTFYLKHLLAALDVLAYIFTPALLGTLSCPGTPPTAGRCER